MMSWTMPLHLSSSTKFFILLYPLYSCLFTLCRQICMPQKIIWHRIRRHNPQRYAKSSINQRSRLKTVSQAPSLVLSANSGLCDSYQLNSNLMSLGIPAPLTFSMSAASSSVMLACFDEYCIAKSRFPVACVSNISPAHKSTLSRALPKSMWYEPSAFLVNASFSAMKL